MTDEQIVKVLALCSARGCDECPRRDNGIPYEDTCRMDLIRIAGDLIERQKAEIEKLKADNKKMLDKWEILDDATKKYYADLYTGSIEAIQTEAIKEFAERLKELKKNSSMDPRICTIEMIDNLVKEMTEGE